MRTFFVIGGIGFLAVGAIMAVYALVAGGVMALGLGLAGVSLLIVGGAFLLVSKFLASMDPTNLLQAGGAPPLRGTAEVLSTRDTGVVLNNVNLVVQLGLRVTPEGGGAPYQAEVKHVLQGRQQWAAIQPGMTLPVLINAQDPTKVVVDESRPVIPGAGVGGGTQMKVESNADLVATGVKSTGTLVHVAPTGMTAGQAKPGLAPEIADDPVMHVVFTYLGPSGQELRSEILVRVPDGKGRALVTGATIPVAYQPDAEHNATIDWDLIS